MRMGLHRFLMIFTAVASVGLAESVEYDFNDFDDGPIDGQQEWNVYNKVKDSSPLSVMDVVGAHGVAGDKALVLQKSDTPIRCVTGEPVRWLPGSTLTVEFDFRLGQTATEPTRDLPVLEFMIGNSLLSEKARWGITLQTLPSGDWKLSGAMPDEASTKIYGENLLIRPASDVLLSDWFKFKLVVKKLEEPDRFDASVEIVDTKGKTLATLKFASKGKDKVTKAMWNLPRVNAGFHVSRDQQGLAVIDNLVISTAK
ncbi:hypothetical protein PDESU_05191 [Pontiella desulfatans]|uniref:Uncharacterized protein n=1 Tax=Pontiella desulfatans TaxID=2750659 RepID=A0A6C2U973_PONDE|nr:hypothetical protein [Pontiella desulfatans]VGO16600.1 hypothetical protein PDESU_05191 [Pontiella desulfatans]